MLTLSITPSSSSNKVFLFISIDVQANHNTNAKHGFVYIEELQAEH